MSPYRRHRSSLTNPNISPSSHERNSTVTSPRSSKKLRTPKPYQFMQRKEQEKKYPWDKTCPRREEERTTDIKMTKRLKEAEVSKTKPGKKEKHQNADKVSSQEEDQEETKKKREKTKT